MRKPGIPPARIPEITRRKQKKNNDSPMVTSKQTTATLRRNESGEKMKSKTDSETRERSDSETALRVRSESAQVLFPIILLLGNFLPNSVHWEGFQGRLRSVNALGVGLPPIELADYIYHLRGDILRI